MYIFWFILLAVLLFASMLFLKPKTEADKICLAIMQSALILCETIMIVFHH